MIGSFNNTIIKCKCILAKLSISHLFSHLLLATILRCSIIILILKLFKLNHIEIK